MEQAETEREEQIAAAFEIVSANGEDRLDEYGVDDEDDEIKDYHEQNVDFADILAEIKDVNSGDKNYNCKNKFRNGI